jgi:hypothetical protein
MLLTISRPSSVVPIRPQVLNFREAPKRRPVAARKATVYDLGKAANGPIRRGSIGTLAERVQEH